MIPAFYERGDAGTLLPTSLAAGPPWLPGTQHGSMVTGLMARAVEATPASTAMHLARLTVELTRPVPTGPTTVTTRVARDGRRLQVLDVELAVGDRTCARGTALRLRVGAGVVDADDAPPPWPGDGPWGSPRDAAIPSPLGPDPLWDAHSARWVEHAPGVGSVWLRPTVPLVAGEPLGPTVRAALVADLVMTSGELLPRSRYVVVNPDVSLQCTRPPAGEWILLRSRVRLGPDGTGHSEGTLSDERGWVGRVTKSLLVDRIAPTVGG